MGLEINDCTKEQLSVGFAGIAEQLELERRTLQGEVHHFRALAKAMGEASTDREARALARVFPYRRGPELVTVDIDWDDFERALRKAEQAR